MGACTDNISPPVRFNEDDPFWDDNGELPAPRAAIGCGFDMSGFPGITPLGGWDADTVSLAYIDVGAGRLWLVETDWQDNSNQFNDDSRTLLGYMLTHRR